jgi:hypothetical protein
MGGHAALEEACQLRVDALQLPVGGFKFGGNLLGRQRVDLADGLQEVRCVSNMFF